MWVCSRHQEDPWRLFTGILFQKAIYTLLYCVLTKSKHVQCVYCIIESSILHCISVHLGTKRSIEVSHVCSFRNSPVFCLTEYMCVCISCNLNILMWLCSWDQEDLWRLFTGIPARRLLSCIVS